MMNYEKHYDGLRIHENFLPGLHTIQIYEERLLDITVRLRSSSKTPIVYTFHDQDLNILYIGKTNNFRARWCAHRKSKDLVQVFLVNLYIHDTMADASFNEAQGIVRNLPPWNVHGKNEDYSQHKIPHTDHFVFVHNPM